MKKKIEDSFVGCLKKALGNNTRKFYRNTSYNINTLNLLERDFEKVFSQVTRRNYTLYETSVVPNGDYMGLIFRIAFQRKDHSFSLFVMFCMQDNKPTLIVDYIPKSDVSNKVEEELHEQLMMRYLELD